jgi:hypothetical protein
VTTSRRTTLALAAALVAALVAAPLLARSLPVPEPSHETGFRIRMVKMAGDPALPETLEHVRYCRSLGFNALWVFSFEAGVWSKQRAPRGLILDESFLRVARWCRENGMEVWVSISPIGDSAEQFVFSDPADENRLLSFIDALQKKAGIRRFVLSFDDQPTELHALRDVFRYGASAAPAEVELAARVRAKLPPGATLFLCGSAYCDGHLGDGTQPYAKGFLAAIPKLPADVGIVWTGPEVISREVTAAGMRATRERLGGRAMLLYDNFPANDNETGDAISLILGALRNRDPGLRDALAVYLAAPEIPLAASRLTLETTAAYLANPEGYDPDAAMRAALAKLGGTDPKALDALTTQQLEWGGWVNGRNYWTRWEANPAVAAGRLQDPAYVESFTWTVDRYPGRMMALWNLSDVPFRDALLQYMRRRLAIARLMPLAVEYRARVRAGDPRVAETVARIDAERQSWRRDADARRIVEAFLAAAQIPSGTPN